LSAFSNAAAPAAWVVRFAHLIREGGSVLDVAAGSGRNARWLAARHFQVTAIDRNQAALDVCGAQHIVCADLEAGEDVLAGHTFDAVLVTNYLHRGLFPKLMTWLAADGVLLYETFAAGQEAYGRPTNPDFLLRRGELLEAFSGLTVIAFEEGIEGGVEPRVVQRLCATRSPHLKPLG
jgi:SAM-dependent methyltransferase